MKKIAITGGLSSGKSTVCLFFKELGSYTVSSDDIVHTLLSHDRILQEKIISLLGSDVATNHRLDREKIARRVFSDVEKLKALERLIHPKVFHEINSIYNTIKNDSRYNLFVAEVPLLFETDSTTYFDAIITVLCDTNVCRERFVKNKNKTESEFNDRMLRQIPADEKAAKSSHIIFNSGQIPDLKDQVTKLHKQILSI